MHSTPHTSPEHIGIGHGRVRRIGAAIALLVASGVMVSASAPLRSDAPPLNSLTTPKAIVLGIVEGVTEYLPISSTGHLLVTERIFDIGRGTDKDATDTFTVVVQIGAILAVLGLYRRRFATMIDGALGRSDDGRRLMFALIAAFIPAGLIGKAFDTVIKDNLLGPWPVVAAWAVGAVAIFAFVAISPRLRVTCESVTSIQWRQALIIGVAQVLALWPGTSRSLVTILAGLAVGLSLTAAVEFSFLLGFLTLSAATVYELAGNGAKMVDTFGWVNPLIGIVAAGAAAWVSVKWMVSYLQRHPLTIFGWYRLGAAVIVATLLLTGTI